MTTHVFIVDANTFKYHLEYQFVGTGAKNYYIDFNGTTNINLKYQAENLLLSMIADGSRVQIGDKVIFYVQQNSQQGIFEGKFYGVFKIMSLLFLDNNDEKQYLKNELGKSLTFRCLIEPNDVYAEGVTEWEALDEIKNIQSPNQMLWSLIYRKLKGNRGNTMITIYESERLVALIRDKNKKQSLQNNNGFTYNQKNQKIELATVKSYQGRQEQINILPRLIDKYLNNKQFEAHLQAYILQQLYTSNLFGIFDKQEIEWVGNEVSCGVGMQRIDICVSLSGKHRTIVPIELKSCCVYPEILIQVQRYIDWLQQYYIPNRQSDIQPIIICRKIDKNSKEYENFQTKVPQFNERNNVVPLMYVEFEHIGDNLVFQKVF